MLSKCPSDDPAADQAHELHGSYPDSSVPARKVEAGNHIVVFIEPRAGNQVQLASDLAQWRTVRTGRHGDGARRAGQPQRKVRCGERRAQPPAAWLPLDRRKLTGGPVAGNVAQLHPDQVVVSGVQAADGLLEDSEADALAVKVDAGPVAHQHGRLAASDHFRKPSALEIRRNKPIDRARREAVPAAEPVAGAANDRDDAPRIGTAQAGRVLDPRRDASPVGKDMAEVVRYLRGVD